MKRTYIRDPWSIRIKRKYDSSFDLIASEDGKEVVVECERWWIGELAEQLWKYLKEERGVIERQEKAMRSE